MTTTTSRAVLCLVLSVLVALWVNLNEMFVNGDSSIADLPLVQKPKSVLSVNGSVTVAGADGMFPFTLNNDMSGNLASIVLDYGQNVAGFPMFDIASISQSPIEIRVSYSESLPNIKDGDMLFNPMIRAFDLDRVNIHTIEIAGHFDTNGIQGAQRYQRIELLTVGASITISSVSFTSAIYTRDPSQSNGAFSCSNEVYNKMWNMGVRTLQLNMVPPRTVQPGFISTDQGLYISPGTAGVFLKGMSWINYNVSFSTLFMKNGISFAIRSNDYSETRVTLNSLNSSHNPNMIQVISAQELYPYETLYYNTSLPNLVENQWYDVFASVNQLVFKVYIDGALIFDINLPQSTNPYIPSVVPGGVGFSAKKYQSAFIKNLKVVDVSGSILHQDPLTSKQSAHDFGVGTNPVAVILDGAKRDRNVWSGDLLVAGPLLYYSYYANEYASGTLGICTSYQLKSGFVSSRIGTGFPYQTIDPSDDFVTPIFYSYTYFLASLSAIEEYYLYSGDLSFVKEQWTRLKLLINAFDSLKGSDGLLQGVNPNWTYDFYPSLGMLLGRFTKLNIQYAMAMESASVLAKAVGETNLAETYLIRANSTKQLVNEKLFDTNSGTYIISDQKSGIAQDTNAFAILSGIASLRGKNFSSTLLDTMKDQLKSGSNYLTFKNAGASFTSPYISYFHAAAAFESNREDHAFDIINSVWTPMTVEGPYFTNAFWESIEIGATQSASNSFAHAWSGGVSPLLSKYVLGIRPTSTGYSEWVVKPQTGSLTWAKGAVQTPNGKLSVYWSNSNNLFSITVEVPPKSKGTVVLQQISSASCVSINSKVYSIGSTVGNGGISKISKTTNGIEIGLDYYGSYQIMASNCPITSQSKKVVGGGSVINSSFMAILSLDVIIISILSVLFI
ncbi:predicted protein [Naegleria gruberi]|uniref:Predicted protein n=1 Tax=Naegleria gruberi TaxID=5762 RepID=D2VWP5_NAEGR|nr:uncharacterized protein NAEGRDRAFT_73456 [Naegleria gruberi]EFC38733.1 predicted protein [Naegleria gruberi]|eukprot:XP_002671477.1 predicted protein [Naegleria gruberi strain NEG-M]